MLDTGVVQAFGARHRMGSSKRPSQPVSWAYTDSLALVRDRLDFLGPNDRDRLSRGTAEQTLYRTPG
jgi:hypothetical protein